MFFFLFLKEVLQLDLSGKKIDFPNRITSNKFLFVNKRRSTDKLIGGFKADGVD